MTHVALQPLDFRVPEQFLQDVVGDLFKAYSKAYALAHSLVPREEAAYLYPHLRRVLFEARFRAIANQYEGITGEAVLNRAQNCHHTEVRAGLFVITASHVENPGDMPRPADFRKRAARLYQLAFDWYEDKPVSREGLQFAVLQHGAAVDEPWRPAFIELTFPNEDYTAFRGRIDLLARYIPVMETEETEVVDANIDVSLKPRKQQDQA